MLTIKRTGIADVKMTHKFGKVAFRGADQQVKVVGHQGVCQQSDLKDIQGTAQQAQKVFPVIQITEDFPPLIPAAGHMIIRIRILDSQGSAHGVISNLQSLKCQ
jgi:hypothetical protein